MGTAVMIPYLFRIVEAFRAALSAQRGAAMVEYALLAALIAVVVATAATTLGGSVSSKFITVNTRL